MYRVIRIAQLGKADTLGAVAELGGLFSLERLHCFARNTSIQRIANPDGFFSFNEDVFRWT